MRVNELLPSAMARPARRWTGAACAFLALAITGCGQPTDSEKPAEPEPKAEETAPVEKPAEPTFDPAKLASAIGVEAGAWQHPEDMGAAAVVTAHKGTIEVRRVGLETFNAVDKEPVALFAGDQIRTGSESTATLMLADRTVVDVAEQTAVAVGDRNATAEPGSSVAVLYGIARFQVSPRGVGEAPFMVFTPSAVATATGTVYTAAVTADGNSRIGVTEGTVEVAGTATLDAPVAVKAGQVTDVDASGDVAAATELAKDANWATWRYEAEASIDAKAAAEAHAHALSELRPVMVKAYGELGTLAEASGEVVAKADAAAEAKDKKTYAQTAPERAATLEATYLASLRLEQLTYAMLAHAYLTTELHVRHPDALAEVYDHHKADLHGAILFHKKFHAVIAQHVSPLRVAFYAHHPAGRAHAKAVGFKVPKFFARVKIKPVPAAAVKKHLQVAVYTPPKVKKPARKKKVSFEAPRADWYAQIKGKAKIKARPAGWYVRPPKAKATAVLGADAKATIKTVFEVPEPKPMSASSVTFAINGELLGNAAGHASAHGHAHGHGHATAEAAHEMAEAKKSAATEAAGKAKVDVRAHGKVKADIKGDLRAHGRGAAKAAGKAKKRAQRAKERAAKMKAKGKAAGKIDVKAPEVKADVEVDVKGGLKIGD